MKMYLPPARPTRRSFLKKGLFGSAVLALGGAGVLLTRPGAELPLPSEPLRAVSPAQYALLSVLAERFVPRRENFPSATDVQVALACDRIIDQLDPSARVEVLRLLTLFESAAGNFVFGGRPESFTRLSEAEQVTVLEEWRDSRLTLRRSGYTALRGMMMAAYYGNPKSWVAIGYPGPPQGIHQPDAPEWRGRGEPRPPSQGRWVEEAAP